MLTAVAGDQGATAPVGGSVSFGRSTLATLKLDSSHSDTSLSRMAGVVQSSDGSWQVVNTASRTALAVDIDGGLSATLAPGAWPLRLPTPCTGRLKVQTVRLYVVELAVTGVLSRIELPSPGDETTTASVADSLELTEREHQFLAALAEARLLQPDVGAWKVPPTTQMQDRLGLTAKQIEGLINSITLKFSQYVDGLIGSNSGRANTRRHQLVDFAIRSGCVARHDLAGLPRARN